MSSRISRFLPLVWLCLVFGGVAAGQGTPIPDGLYLRFNEGSGSTTANDAFPGTLAPNVIVTVPGWIGPPSTPYLGLSALDTAASNQNPSVATGAPYTFASAWTIEFAVDLLANVQPQLFYSTPILDDPTIGFSIAVTDQGAGAWEVSGSLPLIGGGVFSFVTPAQLPLNAWTFYSIVHQPALGTVAVYRDGTLDTTFFLPPGQFVAIASTNPSGMLVGGTFSAPPGSVAVQPIDELRIWNSARTATEISNGRPTEALVKAFETTGVWTFNPTAGTFGVVGSVQGIRVDNGELFTTQGADPVVGASIIGSGNYTGTDLQTYTDIVLSSTTLLIQNNATTDSLSITGGFDAALGAGLGFVFGGPLGALPQSRAPLASPPSPPTVRFGATSPVLDAMAVRLARGSGLSLVLSGSGPVAGLVTIEADYNSPSRTPTFVAATNGSGAFALGVLGCPAAAPLWNVFDVSPQIPVGTGPLLGIALTPFTLEQILLPLPTTPFRVQADANGNYFFAVQNGSLPPGLVVDHVGIVHFTAFNAIISSTVTRITF